VGGSGTETTGDEDSVICAIYDYAGCSLYEYAITVFCAEVIVKVFQLLLYYNIMCYASCCMYQLLLIQYL